MPWQEAFTDRVAGFALPTWEALPDLGLYMDQVITYLEKIYRPLYGQSKRIITSPMINNYVKSGLIARPAGKKYDRQQIAQLIIICGLKLVISLEDLRLLISGSEDAELHYRAFCAQQEATSVAFDGTLSSLTPMQCAVRAAAYTLLCMEMLHGEE